MSEVVYPKQFERDAKPVSKLAQAEMDNWLALGFNKPPMPNAWDGATPADCDLAIERIKLACAAYLDFVATVVEQVHENLPMTQVTHLKQLVETVQNDAVALLEIAADTQAGM